MNETSAIKDKSSSAVFMEADFILAFICEDFLQLGVLQVVTWCLAAMDPGDGPTIYVP